MAAQQLQFEFSGGRLLCSPGESRKGRESVRQVTEASEPAEAAVGVTMEEVVGRQNLQRALKRVVTNQSSA